LRYVFSVINNCFIFLYVFVCGCMSFFDTEEGVEEYLRLSEGYDGSMLIEVLQAQRYTEFETDDSFYMVFNGK